MAQTQRQLEETAESEDIMSYYPELETLLTQRRTELLSRSRNMREQLDEQVMESAGDEGDESVTDTSADYLLTLAEGHRNELVQIENALDRIRRGAYGICESCRNSIDVHRLRKIPFARLCIGCQSATEAGRRIPFPNPYPKI